MYNYNEVFAATLEYFNNDELATKVWIDKYALRDNQENLLEKTPDDMHRRLAKEFARIEKSKFKTPLSEEEIYELFKKFKYIIPQGSPMYGIGNNYKIVSLSNCYVLDTPLDSYNSILDIDKQLVNISKRRGGVGIDLSNLRPKDTPTNNSAKSTTGLVSWMERYSNSIREVGQNARRGALMLTVSIHHPDIIDFCTVKNDPTKVTGANISVRLTREFLNAVKNNADYELRWPLENPTIQKNISAKKVWDIIIHSAWLRAEPGLLMWDNIIENTPTDCYEEYRSTSTNPCSEISLNPLDSCRLMCMNLLSYVDNPFTSDASFNTSLFHKHAQLTQRLMDNLVDLEAEKIEKILQKIDSDPEPEEVKRPEKEMWLKILKNNNEGRRTGTGITALGDTLAALNIKYGSEDSIQTTEEIYRLLKFGCYRSSIDMAKELGAFKIWDHDKEKDCPFFERFKNESVIVLLTGALSGAELYRDMQRYGRRNIALLTTAPTGTVSILTQTSSGIEPVYQLSYVRRKKINPGDTAVKVNFTDKLGDQWQEFTVYHPTLQKWMNITGKTDIKESPWYGVCAEEINWQNRVKLQAAAQKHICHAISSTINLPENVTEEEVGKIYETAFEYGCKGITVYRNNCRSGVLVSTTQIEKRPKELPCDVHHLTVKGKSYLVLVGLVNEKPYEIFSAKNGTSDKTVKKGTIVKCKKHYKAILEDETELSPIMATASDEEETVTRLVSSLLREEVALDEIVKQLDKVHGDLTIFAKSISRTLKKYIKAGTKTGSKCPECGGDLVYQSSCVSCSCGWTKCS